MPLPAGCRSVGGDQGFVVFLDHLIVIAVIGQEGGSNGRFRASINRAQRLRQPAAVGQQATPS